MNWQEISEDITDACLNTFSESVQVHYFNKETNSFEDPIVAKAVFDSDYKQVDLSTGALISSNTPMIEISSRFIPKNLTNKDKIHARGILYKIKEIMPDASGAVKIMLSRS